MSKKIALNLGVPSLIILMGRLFFCFLILIGTSLNLQAKPRLLELESIEAIDPGFFYPRSILWPIQPTPLAESATILPQWGELLNMTGQIQVRERGSNTFSIRGSAQSGRVLSLFNGVPLNFATGFTPPSFLLPKEVFGGVAILRGPSSLFYGSQAMGGSLHFSSVRLRNPRLTVGLSDTDESFLPWKQASLNNNSWSLIVPILQSETSHHQVSLYTEKDSGQFPYSSALGRGVRTQSQSSVSRATIIGHQSFLNHNIDYSLVWGQEVKQLPGSIYQPFSTRLDNSGFVASMAPKLQLNSWISHSVRLSRLEFEMNAEDSVNQLNSKFSASTNIIQNATVFDVNRWTLTFLVDYYDHKLDNTFQNSETGEDSLELAPLVAFAVSDEFDIQAGYRWLNRDKIGVTSAGLFYRPGSYDYWLSWAQGFRRPSLSDLYATTNFSIGNPDLLPEKSAQVELGVKYKPRRNLTSTYHSTWSYELRMFAMQLEDFFESQNIALGQTQRQNSGTGSSSGIESQVSYWWGPWEVAMNYNFLKTVDDSRARPFRLSPRHTWGGSLNHYIGPFRLQLQNINWLDFYDTDPRTGDWVRLNDWSQWNISLGSYGFSHWNISFGINNIFNESKELTFGYPEVQRRYWGKVSYSF